MLILLPVVIILVAYAALMYYYYRCWKNISSFSAGNNVVNDTTVTIIIPVRNEEGSIGRLLKSLQQQSYPAHLTQIIVIDDNSTDSTCDIVNSFTGVELIHLNGEVSASHKKRAIEAGLKVARGEWIVTTDGDCVMGPEWLQQVVAFQRKNNCCYVAAPVCMISDGSFLQQFQQMDFAVLQGVTAVSVHRRLHAMSNGANQAYRRDAFDAVNGFAKIDRIASGDDMLLLQKINKRFPRKVGWLHSKDAIVHTEPAKSWPAFFQQRIRWASKSRHYTEGKIFFVMAIVYLVNLCFPFLLIAGIWDGRHLMYAGVFWLLKTLVEWPFVGGVFRFFDLRFGFVSFFLFQPVHMMYTVISGFLGLFGKYEWKGRRVR